MHRSGSSHDNGDALPRRPWDTDEGTGNSEDCTVCRRIAEHPFVQHAAGPELTLDGMAYAQSCDAALRPLLDSLKINGARPAWLEFRCAPEETRVLWAHYQSPRVRYGLLYRQFRRPDGTLKSFTNSRAESIEISFLASAVQ